MLKFHSVKLAYAAKKYQIDEDRANDGENRKRDTK